MSLDEAVFIFGAFVSALVAAGVFVAFYAPAYREEARRDRRMGERGTAPPGTGEAP